jgi:hypothetical protein
MIRARDALVFPECACPVSAIVQHVPEVNAGLVVEWIEVQRTPELPA